MCGAVVNGDVCEYCGSPTDSVIVRDNKYYKITLPDGHTLTCYLAEVRIHDVQQANLGRDISGRLLKPAHKTKAEIRLIEV